MIVCCFACTGMVTTQAMQSETKRPQRYTKRHAIKLSQISTFPMKECHNVPGHCPTAARSCLVYRTEKNCLLDGYCCHPTQMKERASRGESAMQEILDALCWVPLQEKVALASVVMQAALTHSINDFDRHIRITNSRKSPILRWSRQQLYTLLLELGKAAGYWPEAHDLKAAAFYGNARFFRPVAKRTRVSSEVEATILLNSFFARPNPYVEKEKSYIFEHFIPRIRDMQLFFSTFANLQRVPGVQAAWDFGAPRPIVLPQTTRRQPLLVTLLQQAPHQLSRAQCQYLAATLGNYFVEAAQQQTVQDFQTECSLAEAYEELAETTKPLPQMVVQHILGYVGNYENLVAFPYPSAKQGLRELTQFLSQYSTAPPPAGKTTRAQPNKNTDIPSSATQNLLHRTLHLLNRTYNLRAAHVRQAAPVLSSYSSSPAQHMIADS